jgi:GT2 family glycosyltransferase/predicted TPR repeat methyltransferase
MRFRFSADADAYQVLTREAVRSLARPGWTLSALRGERALFAGSERRLLDLTLSSPEGRCVVILMAELEEDGGPVLRLPERIADAGDSAVAAIAAQVGEALDGLRGDGGEVPSRFLLESGKPANAETVSERLVPGRSPYGTLIAHLQRYRFAASAAGHPRRALDIGCGLGYGLGLLGVEEGTGIDISEEALARARSMYPGMTFLCTDIAAADIGGKAGLVTAFEILEHLADHHPLFDLAQKGLEDGGAFVVSVPNPRYHGTRLNPYHVRDLAGEHLAVMMKARFGEVSFHHQARDIHGDIAVRYRVREGLDPDAEFWVAVGRRPRPVSRPVKASIVMPVCNKVEYTVKSLVSIAEHTPGDAPAFEVIVIDNGSTDGTAEALAGIGGDITVWRNAENLGFAKACNQGALLARGEHVVFLNNDTEVHPGWLSALTGELDRFPDTGVVGGRLLYPDGTIQHAGVAIGRDLIPFHVHRGLSSEDPLVMERREFPVVTAACSAVRRTEFYRIGMFDEEFLNGHEDIDLCFRYTGAGMRVVYEPGCVVTHHESVSEGRMLSRPRNLARSFRKWRHRMEQDDFRYSVRESERGRPDNPLSIAVKIGPPDRTHSDWGDIYFAECLAKAFSRLGHRCRIDYLDEWGKDDLDIDVVIHLKGLSEYRPKPWNVNLLWMLNHPELHTKEELLRYDAVLVASVPHARRLAKELQVPVFTVLQATDPGHFRPVDDVRKDFDLVFVGNNKGDDRLPMRKIVADLLPTPYRLGVWGGGWEGKLPEGVLQGKFVSWDKLPGVYARARIVLNDHQPEMKRHGFLNNRTYDVLACGAVLVSDHVKGMEDILPVPHYSGPAELRRLVDGILKGRKTPDTERLRRDVLGSFTFDRRAEEILEIVSRLGAARDRSAGARGRASSGRCADGPLVSVLMSTYNRRDFLPDAVASVRAQTYRNWELVLVNDGGTDVKDLVARERDPRIRLVDLPEHKGKGCAVNKAFEVSGGDLIAYLDDDDIWYPDHLERLVLPLTSIPGIDMAYSDAYNVKLRPGENGAFREEERTLDYHHQVDIRNLLSNNHIQGLSVVHRRRLFHEVGGMDPTLQVLIDWDLWRRLAAVAFPYHVSRVTADHFLREVAGVTGKGQITNYAKTDPLKYYRNRYRVVMKNILPPDSPFLDLQRSVQARERVDFLMRWGEHHEKAGKTEAARKCYRHAMGADRSNLRALVKMGLLELSHGDPARALELFVEAINRNRRDVASHLYAVLSCLEMKRGRDALLLLDDLERLSGETTGKYRELLEDYRRRAVSIRDGGDGRLLQVV